MKLNLSDEPATAELLSESLRRTGSAVIAVNGTSMHPTLQMGWRVFLAPARGEDLRVGEIAVFRGHNYLTIHRLVFRERGAAGEALVFRGDYNRQRERVDPCAGTGKVVAIEPDILARFYRLSQIAASLLRPVLPPTGPGAPPPGRLGRAARSLFSFAERFLSVFLPERR